MPHHPTTIKAVIPSRLRVGQPFTLKVKVLGEPVPVPCASQWRTAKPGLRTPFNLNVERQIQFVDNTVAGWRGTLRLVAPHFDGPSQVVLDGTACGSYENDDRPIKSIPNCRFQEPGFHFIRLIDEDAGLEGWSNPVLVTAEEPAWQIAWGDPHTHTFFTDAIRCPEDIYHFARHEGFLDFCALADHSEGLTDAQWGYFQAVTNAANRPGDFVTLLGQEWTHHVKEHGAPGHRNIYVPGDHMPIVRCTDPATCTLDRLWATLDTWQQPVLALPHHSANVVMGTDWDQPWNPTYERAVEIYSVWGSSERLAAAGNPRPIYSCGGEMAGRHVQEALRRGRRFSFIGGGDTHDGRPGDALHMYSYPPRGTTQHEQGFTAARVPTLTRQHVFEAIAGGQTYATTASRIYLDVVADERQLRIQAASEEGVARIDMVVDGEDVACHEGGGKVVDETIAHPAPGQCDYLYVRLTTGKGNMAWSSPFYAGA